MLHPRDYHNPSFSNPDRRNQNPIKRMVLLNWWVCEACGFDRGYFTPGIIKDQRAHIFCEGCNKATEHKNTFLAREFQVILAA